jgi:hypothetical protein
VPQILTHPMPQGHGVHGTPTAFVKAIYHILSVSKRLAFQTCMMCPEILHSDACDSLPSVLFCFVLFCFVLSVSKRLAFQTCMMCPEIWMNEGTQIAKFGRHTGLLIGESARV